MSKKSEKKEASTRSKFLLNKETPFLVEEAYKTLRTNLMFSLPDVKCRKILFTSSDVGEGKSSTFLNLGVVMAANGSKCLLVDCDLRLSRIADTLKITEIPGLSDNLANGASYEKIIQHYSENLDVVTAGTTPPNPSELLGSANMQKFIADMEENYDYILFDTPPIGLVTDAAILSRMTDGFVFVVRCGKADKNEVARCVHEIENSGAKMLGFTLTCADVSFGKGKSYYYKK